MTNSPTALDYLFISNTSRDYLSALQQRVYTLETNDIDIPQLSDLSNELGVIYVGNFIAGEGDPFDQVAGNFTGAAMCYPPITIGSNDYSIFGQNAGTLQFGISALTGRGVFAGENGIIDADGLTLSYGGVQTFSLGAAGGIFKLGSNLAAAATTSVLMAGTSLSYNGETLGAGAVLLGDNSTSKANILWDPATSKLYFRGGKTAQAWIDTTGSIVAAGGYVKISSTGILMSQDGILNEYNNLVSGYGEIGLFEMIPGFGLSQISFTSGQQLTITNPGFESGSTGWTLTGASVSSAQAHGGSNSLRFNADLQNAISTSFINVSNAAALIRFWMYGAGTLAVSVRCYNSGGTYLGDATDPFGLVVPVDANWKEYAFCGQYRTGTTKVKIQITMYGTGITIYVDDLQLFDGWGAQLGRYANGLLLSGDMYNNMLTSTRGILGTLEIGGAAGIKTLDVQGDFGLSGLATMLGGIEVTNGNVRSGLQAINDDAVYSFTPTKSVGLIVIGTSSPGYGGIVFYTTNVGNSWLMVGGANITAGAGVLTGTTGTDVRVNISAHTDGKIYIENRSGAARNYFWLLI